MNVTIPTVSRIYRHYVIDSTRWQRFVPRADDVVVATPYKSGTTWMQAIVGHLIFNDLKQRDPHEFGRWLDACFGPVDDDLADLEAMQHRRVLKSHLALDGLPYYPALHYIYVGRDLRDMFMSLWNHHNSYTPEILALMSSVAKQFGVTMPLPPTDIHSFWHEFMTRGYFEWEGDGYPYWSALRHLKTWWAFRHLPNVMFVHFNDLLDDLEGEIARVARFLGISLGAARYKEIAQFVTFAAMKRDAEIVNPGAHFAFKGGPTTFINKGTNGRWRDVLTAEDLALYDDTMRSQLPPDAGSWLESGNRAQAKRQEATIRDEPRR